MDKFNRFNNQDRGDGILPQFASINFADTNKEESKTKFGLVKFPPVMAKEVQHWVLDKVLNYLYAFSYSEQFKLAVKSIAKKEGIASVTQIPEEYIEKWKSGHMLPEEFLGLERETFKTNFSGLPFSYFNKRDKERIKMILYVIIDWTAFDKTIDPELRLGTPMGSRSYAYYCPNAIYLNGRNIFPNSIVVSPFNIANKARQIDQMLHSVELDIKRGFSPGLKPSSERIKQLIRFNKMDLVDCISTLKEAVEHELRHMVQCLLLDVGQSVTRDDYNDGVSGYIKSPAEFGPSINTDFTKFKNSFITLLKRNAETMPSVFVDLTEEVVKEACDIFLFKAKRRERTNSGAYYHFGANLNPSLFMKALDDKPSAYKKAYNIFYKRFYPDILNEFKKLQSKLKLKMDKNKHPALKEAANMSSSKNKLVRVLSYFKELCLETEDWWKKQTKEFQENYIKEHQNTDFKLTHHNNVTGIKPDKNKPAIIKLKPNENKFMLASEDRNSWPEHIVSLKLPPAWTDIKYNLNPEADLLAVGKDKKGRSQYVYSEKFSNSQAELKFNRISALDSEINEIRKQNESLGSLGDPKVTDNSECLSLIMTMGIRPGSEEDTGAEKTAYGATTLKGEHVVKEDKKVYLRFTGKKGVDLNLEVENPEIAKMLLSRAKKAGASGKLFPNTNEANLLKYTHSLGSGNYKTKDFRTWVGTNTALQEISKMEAPKNLKEYKKAVRSVAVEVAKKLGNTPVIALQSYISPVIFSGWKSGIENN